MTLSALKSSLQEVFSNFSGSGQQFGSFHMHGGGSGSHEAAKRMAAGFPASGHMGREHQNRDKNIKITLENKELWQKFHAIGTEMIITKSGRWAHVSN